MEIEGNKNQLRIIGGKRRGRKLQFPSLPGLRPTPDRGRETLFNWLMHDIIDAHCLDLYAGSGALGFEALSRGAAEVLFIDVAPEAVQALVTNANKLNVDDFDVRCLRLPCVIEDSISTPIDIVFLDPPFKQGLIAKTCEWLDSANILADHALIYIEAEKELTPLPIPHHWKMLRNKVAGNVAYYLISR